MIRKCTAFVMLAALLTSPAVGFDTYWHSQCSQKVGEQFAFTEDAWKIMQLGNFSPDFFGPVAEYAAKGLKDEELDALTQFKESNQEVRGAAIFFHFDNLNGDLQNNAQFDYLFAQLLANTQKLLASYNKLPVDDRTRKVLTLVTLGASLHAIQDFYSHSDWIHQDFDHTDVKMIKLPSNEWRAPTWFEFRSKHSDPRKWPFQLKSGIYPPPAGVLNTHTHMNHDNSRLSYTEFETPGQPYRSQAQYHKVGPVPALGDDASDLAHQQLAVHTAQAASIEWFKKVEQNSAARKVIESAKVWTLKTRDPHLAKELETGTLTMKTLACASGKWDGDDPPGDQGLYCRSALERRMNSAGNATSQLESEIISLAADFAMPMALKFTGLFWDVHGQYHILERLVQGMAATSGGRYDLPKK